MKTKNSTGPFSLRGRFGEEARGQLVLAGPLALSFFGQNLMGLVDTAMLGRYDSTSLAAAGIANLMLSAIVVFGLGVLMGLDTLLPQALGAGDEKRAYRLLRSGLTLAVILGVVLLAFVSVIPALMRFIGFEESVAAAADVYILWRLPGVLAFLLFGVLRCFLQAKGVTTSIVVATIVCNVLNVLCNGLLIYGDGALISLGLPAIGMPSLGILGAALTTSIVSVVAMIILYLPVRSLTPDLAGTPWFSRAESKSIVVLGVPTGLHLVSEVGLHVIAAMFVGTLGATQLAAHNIAIMMVGMTSTIMFGIGVAASMRMAGLHASGEQPGPWLCWLVALACGALLSVPVVTAFLLASTVLADFFTDDPSVLATTVPLVVFGALFHVVDGAQIIAAGGLRGLGDTRTPLIVSIVSNYGLGLGLSAFLLFGLGLGPKGVWIGLSVGLFVAFLLMTARLWKISRAPMGQSA